jgi:LysM domain
VHARQLEQVSQEQFGLEPRGVDTLFGQELRAALDHFQDGHGGNLDAIRLVQSSKRVTDLPLELGLRATYVQRMKRFWLIALLWCAGPTVRSQDAATEERLNKINGQIEDLLAAQAAQQKRLAALARELADLREQALRPNPAYAGQDEVRRLAETVREVDRKRLEDYDKIRAELLKLGKTLAVAPPPAKKSSPPPPSDVPAAEKTGPPEKGFEYVIQRGDTLAIIVQAYREKNIKVSTEQILKANPGLKPEKLYVGRKIFIPAPAGSSGQN